MRLHDTRSDLPAELFGILAVAHPNVLLIGPRAATDRVVAPMSRYVRLPLVRWSPCEAAPLPQEQHGTLLIPAIDTADHEQQSQLYTWLAARAGCVQVLALTTRPLFPLVTRGAFLARLYYLLNQLYVDLAGMQES
jgi:hypothetical protein